MSEAQALNALFAQKLDNPAERTKLAALAQDLIRDRLREESFRRKIIPPKTVGRQDLQVSITTDTLVYIVEVEAESRAMSMTFRDQPSPRYYTSGRFEVAFHTIGSERFEQTEQELMAYTYPITNHIKKNIVNDIQEVEDLIFMSHIESAVQSLQRDVQGMSLLEGNFTDAQGFSAYNVNNNGVAERGKVKSVDVLQNTAAGSDAAGVAENLSFAMQKDDLIKLEKLFPGTGGARNGRLKMDCMLLTDTDLADTKAWSASEVGDDTVRETTIQGWKHSTLIGYKYIRTLKTDILRPGNIYAFAPREFWGGSLTLNNVKFYADKERNRVSFEAWEDVAMYIGNVAGIRKLELFAGAVETVSADNSAITALYNPLKEVEMGKENNLVAKDVVFPKVSRY